MGQAVDLPLIHGPGWYIVMEQGDSMFCREAGVISAAAGKIPSGTVMARLAADRTATDGNGATVTQRAGEFVPYFDGAANAYVLWQGIDARVKGAKRTLTIRDTQVQKSSLTVAFAANNSQLQTMYSLLAANNIILR